MKLKEYALLAEIAGAIAVVMSLIYVGYQIQANTAEKRVDSIQSLTNAYRELALVYVNNEQAGIAWHKVLTDQELTMRQLELMSDNIYAHLMVLEETYNKYLEGYIDEAFLDARVALIQTKLLRSPQIRQSFETMKENGIYTQPFVDWLETVLRQSSLYDNPRPITSLADQEAPNGG